jgi:hypothetical protein
MERTLDSTMQKMVIAALNKRPPRPCPFLKEWLMQFQAEQTKQSVTPERAQSDCYIKNNRSMLEIDETRYKEAFTSEG